MKSIIIIRKIYLTWLSLVGLISTPFFIVQCDEWPRLHKWLFLLGDKVGDVHFYFELPPHLHLGNHHLPIQGCGHGRSGFVLSRHKTVSAGDVPVGLAVFYEGVFF